MFLVRPTQSSDTSLEKQAQNFHSSIKRINKLVQRTEKDNVEDLSLVVTQLRKSRSVAFIIFVQVVVPSLASHMQQLWFPVSFGLSWALRFSDM